MTATIVLAFSGGWCALLCILGAIAGDEEDDGKVVKFPGRRKP